MVADAFAIFDDMKMFTGGMTRKSTIPKVRLSPTKSGKINLYLNALFMKSAEDNSKSHLLFSFSQKANAIIFEFIEKIEIPGIIKISRPKNSGSAIVSFQAFSSRFGLDAEKVKGNYIPVFQKVSDRRSAWVIFLDNKIIE